MGINVHGMRFLLYAKSQGVDFTTTAMIGRQSLHLGYRRFRSVLSEFGHDLTEADCRAIYDAGYADELLKYLGASTVESFDCSAYEGATCVHDFNKPIPSGYEGKYTVVLEGGTLEHIFNVPVALANCMKLVAIGGHFLGITMANNYMGHGLYQFSPELFFRAFSGENGFQTQDIMVYGRRNRTKCFRVIDPCRVGRGTVVANVEPTMMVVFALRVADKPIFATTPEQSDCVATRAGERGKRREGATILRRLIPRSVRALAQTLVRPYDPAFFKPFRLTGDDSRSNE